MFTKQRKFSILYLPYFLFHAQLNTQWGRAWRFRKSWIYFSMCGMKALGQPTPAKLKTGHTKFQQADLATPISAAPCMGIGSRTHRYVLHRNNARWVCGKPVWSSMLRHVIILFMGTTGSNLGNCRYLCIFFFCLLRMITISFYLQLLLGRGVRSTCPRLYPACSPERLYSAPLLCIWHGFITIAWFHDNHCLIPWQPLLDSMSFPYSLTFSHGVE